MSRDAVPHRRRARERMSSVDTAWLHMDAPQNLMMIVGVLVFDHPLDLERFRRVVYARLLRYPRFHSKVVHEDAAIGGTLGPLVPPNTFWEVDRDFDLTRHVFRASLPGAADKRALEDMVGLLAAEPLPVDRPLWEMRVIDRYVAEDGSEKAALITRIHHCIADGIALVGVMLSLTSASRDMDPEPDHAGQEPSVEDDENDATDNPWEAMLRPVTELAVGAIQASGRNWMRYAETMTQPGKLAEAAMLVSQVAADAARVAAMADDTPTLLKGKPGVPKRLAWNEPLPLSEVKVISKAFGCSVNDVLLSCVAGALRAYLVERGQDMAGCELRAMVPVNLRHDSVDPRRADPRKALGNKFGLAPLVLPVGIENPIERLYEVRKRMAELKNGYQAMVAYALLGVVGHLPKSLQNELLGIFARKTTAVMTNVPGPQEQLYLAGSRLDQLLFWVPQSGDVGMGVSILSYNEGVQFGLITAGNLVPHPEQIITRFQPEFERLVLISLMCPWSEEDIDPQRAAEALAETDRRPAPHRPTTMRRRAQVASSLDRKSSRGASAVAR